MTGKVGNRFVILKDYGVDVNSVIEVIDPFAKALRETTNGRGQYGIMRIVYKSKLKDQN